MIVMLFRKRSIFGGKVKLMLVFANRYEMHAIAGILFLPLFLVWAVGAVAGPLSLFFRFGTFFWVGV